MYRVNKALSFLVSDKKLAKNAFKNINNITSWRNYIELIPANIFSMILFAISGSPPEAAAAIRAAAALASILPPKTGYDQLEDLPIVY